MATPTGSLLNVMTCQQHFVPHLILSIQFSILASIDAILIKLSVLLTMPVASATAERSFSVLGCLENYVRSTMKNDRLSSLGLVHIHRDFEVDLYKAMEVFVSAKTRRADFGQF
jgi:hypothetical protein